MKGVLLFVGILIILSSLVYADCVVPTDGMIITQNTIFCPGTYNLPNGIIIGADEVVLDCNGAILENEWNSSQHICPGRTVSNAMVRIRGNNGTVKNCVIINSTTGINDHIPPCLPYPPGGDCQYNNNIINNTLLFNKINGIRLCGNNNLIRGNTVINNSEPFTYGFNGGIMVTGDNNVIDGNYVENNYMRNIYAHGQLDVPHSRILGVNNTIKNNYITIGSFGIDATHYSRIINNTVVGIRGFYGAGIEHAGTLLGNNQIENNTLFNNTYGLLVFSGAPNNTINGNKFDSNRYGIYLGFYTTTSGSVITKNIFVNNTNSAISIHLSSFSNSILDNDIYNTGIRDDNESLNIYCINCVGNRYYDNATGPSCPSSCLDNDGDGYISDIDCNDDNASIHPNATEVCNGVDDNCNNETDEGYDLDYDGIAECYDNCPYAHNPNQEDEDKDSVGDVCDSCLNTKLGEAVDTNGCSNPQFCIKQGRCGLSCDLADWKNDEPLSLNPHDCITVIVHRGGIPEPMCAGLTCAD